MGHREGDLASSFGTRLGYGSFGRLCQFDLDVAAHRFAGDSPSSWFIRPQSVIEVRDILRARTQFLTDIQIIRTSWGR